MAGSTSGNEIARQGWLATAGSVNGATGFVFAVSPETLSGEFELTATRIGGQPAKVGVAFYRDMEQGMLCGLWSPATETHGRPCGSHGIVWQNVGALTRFDYRAWEGDPAPTTQVPPTTTTMPSTTTTTTQDPATTTTAEMPTTTGPPSTGSTSSTSTSTTLRPTTTLALPITTTAPVNTTTTAPDVTTTSGPVTTTTEPSAPTSTTSQTTAPPTSTTTVLGDVFHQAMPRVPLGPVRAEHIGIGHDGVTRDSDTPSSSVPVHAWSDWDGQIHGSPLISGDRAFVLRLGSSTASLSARRLSDGETLWNVALSGTYGRQYMTYDEQRVYVVNFDGRLRAFDSRDGSLLWSRQLPGQYAFSSSPTADGGSVYVAGAGSGGTLYAVSGATGDLQWTAPVTNGDNSSPALDADTVYVSYACNQAYAFDRVSGTLRWHHDGPCSGGGGATASLHDGKLYTRDFGTNLILDAATGTELGEHSSYQLPAFDGDLIFSLDYEGNLVAARPNGTTAWRATAEEGRVFDTAPIVVNGALYIGDGGGRLTVFQAATGAVLDRVDLGYGQGPTASAGSGYVLFPTSDGLKAFKGY